MKKDTATNLTCVYNTIDFIEKNYDQAIAIEALEDISNYSYRNIQRIFRYTCGETIGAYQKRLRVENAYKMLLYTNNNISSVALKVGFANVASFSKAFRQHFNVGPKTAKSQKVPLLMKAEIFPVEATEVLKPEIVYLPGIKVYYKSAFVSYEHDEIELLWDKFMENDFPDQGNEFYGIVADEPLIRAHLTCRYDACSLMQSRSEKLLSKVIGGGKYARFTHYGGYETIEDTYSKIYSGWILTAGLEFGHTPVIEKYIRHPDNTAAGEDQLTYICLPLS